MMCLSGVIIFWCRLWREFFYKLWHQLNWWHFKCGYRGSRQWCISHVLVSPSSFLAILINEDKIFCESSHAHQKPGFHYPLASRTLLSGSYTAENNSMITSSILFPMLFLNRNPIWYVHIYFGYQGTIHCPHTSEFFIHFFHCCWYLDCKWAFL